MQGNNQRQPNHKFSMTISVCIALCLVSVFCAISILIVENIDSLSKTTNMKLLILQDHHALSELVL